MAKSTNSLTRTYIKNAFKTEGIQLPGETLNLIVDHFRYEIANMTIRCKKGNVKRLTPDLFYIALGRHDNHR